MQKRTLPRSLRNPCANSIIKNNQNRADLAEAGLSHVPEQGRKAAVQERVRRYDNEQQEADSNQTHDCKYASQARLWGIPRLNVATAIIQPAWIRNPK